MKGFAKYEGEHILLVLNTNEHHNVKNVISCLEKKYRTTRWKKLKEFVSDWMKFNENDFDDEDGFIKALEKIQIRKD